MSGLACLIEGGGATRGERRNRVVSAIGCAHVARSADSQHPRGVARCGDAAVLHASVPAASVVPGRGDDSDAGAHRAFGGERQRIDSVGLVDGRRDR